MDDARTGLARGHGHAPELRPRSGAPGVDATAVERARALVETLAREHWDTLFRIAYGVLGNVADAEEATQEALLKVLRSCVLGRVAESAQPLGRTGLPGGLLPFAVTVVRNASIDVRRRQRRHRDAVAEQTARAEREARAGEAPAWSALELREALAGLTPEQELVVLLHAYEGWTFKEIAVALSEKESTVSMRYYRALTQVRGRLSGDDGDGR